MITNFYKQWKEVKINLQTAMDRIADADGSFPVVAVTS